MPRIVRCGVIQTHCEWSPEKHSLADIKEKMIAKHERLIADAAKKKVQILGLQELFYGPYFCAEQNNRWHELTEKIPGGPTLMRMQKLAKKYGMVLIVPMYEEDAQASGIGPALAASRKGNWWRSSSSRRLCAHRPTLRG